MEQKSLRLSTLGHLSQLLTNFLFVVSFVIGSSLFSLESLLMFC